MSLRWTEEEYAIYIASRKATGKVSSAISAAHLERDAVHGPPSTDGSQKVDKKFHINVHSKRRRLIDPDGLYAKAAIDGLTEGGILVDDSAMVVAAVTYSQEKSKVEETIIEIFEV
jgi:hypothetical protein